MMTIHIYSTMLMDNDQDFNEATQVDSFEGTQDECEFYFAENYDINDFFYSF